MMELSIREAKARFAIRSLRDEPDERPRDTRPCAIVRSVVRERKLNGDHSG